MQIRAVRVITPQDCMYGLCDCEGAQNCYFPRCDNCDAILYKDGKAHDNPNLHRTFTCEDCGGPIEA